MGRMYLPPSTPPPEKEEEVEAAAEESTVVEVREPEPAASAEPYQPVTKTAARKRST